MSGWERGDKLYLNTRTPASSHQDRQQTCKPCLLDNVVQFSGNGEGVKGAPNNSVGAFSEALWSHLSPGLDCVWSIGATAANTSQSRSGLKPEDKCDHVS